MAQYSSAKLSKQWQNMAGPTRRDTEREKGASSKRREEVSTWSQQQGECLTAIEEDGDDKRLVQLENAIKCGPRGLTSKWWGCCGLCL